MVLGSYFHRILTGPNLDNCSRSVRFLKVNVKASVIIARASTMIAGDKRIDHLNDLVYAYIIDY